jgi:hypothetical protein
VFVEFAAKVEKPVIVFWSECQTLGVEECVQFDSSCKFDNLSIAESDREITRKIYGF